MHAFIVVDKPAGVSSHHIVAMFRALLGKPKVGHTGTLDPFATGVLVLAFGTCTRFISFLPEEHKGYLATLKLGEKSETGDTEGEIVERTSIPNLKLPEIQARLSGMAGEQLQRPPPFSAVKHKGKPLYHYARKGVMIEAPPKKIRIYQLQAVHLEPEHLHFSVVCSKGTYVRCLGEEIAQKMGTVGHLCSLRRTKSGFFTIEQAITLSELSVLVTGIPDWKSTLSLEGKKRFPRIPPESLWERLRPYRLSLESIFHRAPTMSVSAERREKIQNGLPPLRIPEHIPPKTLFWMENANRFVALGEHDGTKVYLRRVLPKG